MVAGEGGDTGLDISIPPNPRFPCLPPPFRYKTHWKTQSLWTVNTLEFTGPTSILTSNKQSWRLKAQG